MTQAPAQDGTATALGLLLGRALRVVVAVALLGGLLGAALGAARQSSLGEFAADLDGGRVTEIEFADTSTYLPGLDREGAETVVRWRPAGAGWRTARLDPTFADGPYGVDLDREDPDGSVVTGPDVDGIARSETVIRARAAAAGVPVVDRGPDAAHRLVRISTIVSLLLVLVLIGGPQPRRATKWAWFWLMLVPGGVTQLAWVALEAPWSSRANRRPEPLPHRDQPGDTRLTGGWAFLLCLPVSIAVALAGWSVASWLTG